MKGFRSRVVTLISVLLTLAMFSFPATAEEATRHTRVEDPSITRMAAELFVRPVMLVGTVVSTALFVVTLPFTVLSDDVGTAADTLVTGPFKTTFMRCLGCTYVEGVNNQ